VPRRPRCAAPCLTAPASHARAQIVEAAGGLHKFMGRDPARPLITDSGGFQVFSLAYGSVADDLNEGNIKGVGAANRRGNKPSVVRTSEEGVTFRSYRDGRAVLLTPESTVQAQKALGADIIIPLDELPPLRVDAERLRKSVLMSHRWEARSLKEHLKDRRQQAMYAVVHGGVDRALRPAPPRAPAEAVTACILAERLVAERREPIRRGRLRGRAPATCLRSSARLARRARRCVSACRARRVESVEYLSSLPFDGTLLPNPMAGATPPPRGGRVTARRAHGCRLCDGRLVWQAGRRASGPHLLPLPQGYESHHPRPTPRARGP